jgi:hypothetical protein
MPVKKCMLTCRISNMAQLLVVLTWGIGYFKGTAPRLNFDEPGRASTEAQTAEPRRLTSSTISGLSVPFSSRPISAAKVVVGTHLDEVRGVVSSNMRSTCSRVKPLVSGIRK